MGRGFAQVGKLWVCNGSQLDIGFQKLQQDTAQHSLFGLLEVIPSLKQKEGGEQEWFSLSPRLEMRFCLRLVTNPLQECRFTTACFSAQPENRLIITSQPQGKR